MWCFHEIEVNSNGFGHMTEMAAMPNMVKTFKFWTQRLMTLKLGMQQLYQLCPDDDPGLALTYFTARSNLVPFAYVWDNT